MLSWAPLFFMANILFSRILNYFMFYWPSGETSVLCFQMDNRKNRLHFVGVPQNGLNLKSNVYIPQDNWYENLND